MSCRGPSYISGKLAGIFFIDTGVHLGPCQTSTMKLFCENSKRLNIFLQKSPVVGAW